MRRISRTMTIRKAFVLSLLLAVFLSFPAVAAESIDYVRLELGYTPVVGGYDFSSIFMDGYQDSYDYRFTVDVSSADYRDGATLPITATLTAADGFTFVNIKKGSCKLNDIAAETVSVEEGGARLVAHFELPALCRILPQPENLYLTENGIAGWDKVTDADRYVITIQYISDYGSRTYVREATVENSKADISDFLYSGPNDYLYSVAAQSNFYWLLDSDASLLPVQDSVLVTWDDIGYTKSVFWDDGRAHTENTSEYATDTMLKIAGKTYYFGSDGLRESGWKLVDGTYYYFDGETLAMVKGDATIDGRDYFFDETSGAMQTGFVTYEGKECFFSEDGWAVTGWVRDGGKIYYILPDGERNYSQLIDRNGRTYMFDSGDGHLLYPKN